MQDAPSDVMQIVAFSIDGVEYAFRIEAVKEIIRYMAPQPTSSRVPWMRGVINLRGSIVPVIELGARLGRETDVVDPKSAKILVLEDGEHVVGAVVTSVDEVRTVEREQVQQAPEGTGTAFIDSVVTLDERLVMLLDAGATIGAPAAEAQAA